MRGTRFERRRILPVRSRLDANAPRRPRQRVGIAGRFHPAFDDHIGIIRDVGMHPRRIRSKRLAGIDHRRQFADFEFDRVGHVLRRGRRRGDDRRHRLADEAHHVFRQNRLLDRLIVELLQHRPDRPHAVEIGVR